MADGTGCVADVRLAEEQDTGRKKGYAFVDFIDVPSAERACKELQGIVQLIYLIFLIFWNLTVYGIHNYDPEKESIEKKPE